MSNQNTMLKREQAGQEAEKVQRRAKTVEYRVEDNDILILSGTYIGSTVRQLFSQGPNERDYIIKKIWFGGDSEVVKIINELVCE